MINNKNSPKDKLSCDFCKKTYTRQNKAQHRRSKYCQAYQQMLKVIKESLLTPLINDHPVEDKIKRPYLDQDNNLIYLTKRQLYFYKKLGSKKYQFTKA